MLDIKLFREQPDLVRDNCIKKLADPLLVDEVISLDINRRELIGEVEELKSKRNTNSQLVADKKKAGQNADDIIAMVREIGERIKVLDESLRTVESTLSEKLSWIPNIAHNTVPVGTSADDNVEVRRVGDCEERQHRKDHLEIGASLGLLDFERGAKVAGSGFGFLTGMGARLERALINYSFDCAVDAGYTEMIPPFVVNPSSAYGTGQLPKSAEEMYHIEKDELYLVPTAEVPLTNFYRDEVLSTAQVPSSFVGYSACFRREAGSHGKDTRGFLRVHQFNKVELVHFSNSSDSYSTLERMVNHVESMLQALGLTYRVLLLCTGDMTFGGSKTYDLEVWAPAEQRWLEVSSCTNFEDFQARRANIRYRPEHGSKPEFVHTLNGSGLATPRILVSILEQHQQADGTIKVPDVLVPYVGQTVIK